MYKNNLNGVITTYQIKVGLSSLLCATWTCCSSPRLPFTLELVAGENVKFSQSFVFKITAGVWTLLSFFFPPADLWLQIKLCVRKKKERKKPHNFFTQQHIGRKFWQRELCLKAGFSYGGTFLHAYILPKSLSSNTAVHTEFLPEENSGNVSNNHL